VRLPFSDSWLTELEYRTRSFVSFRPPDWITLRHASIRLVHSVPVRSFVYKHADQRHIERSLRKRLPRLRYVS